MIPTPHISAKEGDFARTVLMPGDPKRSRFIAEHFLSDAVLVNDVRGVQGYTGTYNGKRVSVMASGMGMPAIGIYSYELFRFYGVENIIRIGSAGAMTDKLPLRGIVAAATACTDSNYASQFGLSGEFCPCADPSLLRRVQDAAAKAGIPLSTGPVFSTDAFYYQGQDVPPWKKLAPLGVLCVEMEAYALYCNAAAAGKNALALLTISDSLVTGESLGSLERQNTFTDMMKIALEIA